MSEKFDELNCWGCKVTDALNRLVNDEKLFIYCLKTFAQDEGFRNLETAIKNKEFPLAFTTAHTLKGVAGNLSLTPLYEALSILVEALRNREYLGTEEMSAEVIAHYRSFKDIVSNIDEYSLQLK